MRVLKRYFRILKSLIASLLLGSPGAKLKLIGVTGTSGKSTTSALVYHILKENNFKVGLISTVGAIAGESQLDTGLHVTTPDPVDLQKLLKKMVDSRIEYVVLESSSHSLDQGRLGLIKLDYAVYTNIKRDHLDYHKNWNNYAMAKERLIRKLKVSGKFILNRDDKKAYEFLKGRNNNRKMIEYSAKDEILELIQTQEGLSFNYQKEQFTVPLFGKYNVENILAGIKLASDLGINLKNISVSLKTFAGIEGRMQVIKKSPFMIIVDFAHNTDSLRNSLLSAKNLLKDNGKLISIFGSAGLRDVEKRGTMGETSGELADITIVTAEDPRTESLYEINTKIIEGAEKFGAKLVKRFADHKEYSEFVNGDSLKNFQSTKIKKAIFSFDEESVNSRYDAIELGIKLSQPGDVMITEGKGHEKSLCFGKIEYPFSDQEAILKYIK